MKACEKSFPHKDFLQRVKIYSEILEIDYENRRLSLGVKQLTENPWIKFNEANPVGTIIDTEIMTKAKLFVRPDLSAK